ncbi:MAG: hypothetical protein GF320_19745 [Armatimonadia bacterium]|nr:hypothetical protein [Armatimonadia bacterium]
MSPRLLALAALLCLPAAGLADVGAPTELIAPRLPTAPDVDGELADDPWTAAPAGPAFVAMQPGPSAAGAVLRAGWTSEELFLSFDAPISRELILMLDPGRDQRGGVLLHLNSKGLSRLQVLQPPGPLGLDMESIRCQVSVDRRWTGEVAIPWESLGLSPDRAGMVGFDAILLGAENQGSSRWSQAAASADPDLASMGVLILDDNPLRFERASWESLHLDGGAVEVVLRNAGDAQREVYLEAETFTPYVGGRETGRKVLLAPYQRLEVAVPVDTSMPGAGRLALRARSGSSTGRLLFQAVDDYTSDARFFVRGIGWLSLTLDHKLAGRTPIAGRVQALECEPHPASQPPVTLETALIGPLGPGERRLHQASRVLDAIQVATLQERVLYAAEDLLAGDYAVECRIVRGDVVLGEARHLVRVSQHTEESLGFTGPTETLESLRLGVTDPPPTERARRGTAALVYRLDRAWDLYDRGDLRSRTALEERYGAIRAETAEAARIAAHLRAGERPYGGESGVFLMAHWSEIDDTAQPYGLYVPDTYADTRATGLVLVLHGWDGNNTGFGFPTNPNDSYYASAKQRGWLVAWPWGRGNQDWRDSGETDLYDVIEEIKALYSIDESRIYLAGISMGGRGVWHHAMRRPDVWAGVVPIAGASSGQVWTVWQEERLAPNLRNVPSYILHGAKDSVVPVEDARTMYRSLADLEYAVEYEEFPTRGHEGFGDAIPRVFQWMDGHRRESWPSRVTYHTEWLRWAKAYWVTIEGLETAGRLGRIDARIERGNEAMVETDGITAFALDLASHPGVDLRTPMEVWVDGTRVLDRHLPPGGVVRMELRGGEWTEAPGPPDLRGARVPRTRYTAGPMRRIFGEPFQVAYGTLGWDDGRLLAAYDMARRTCERWEWWMWGEQEPRADSEVAAEGSAGLLLYGGPDMNLLSSDLRMPVALEPDLAVKSAEPSPWNPRYLAAAFSAPDGEALRRIGVRGEVWPLPPVPFAAQDADFQAARVDGEGRLWPVAEGSYDELWSLPELEPGLWVFSDASWKASNTAADGWTEIGFDDAEWARPRVRLRKEFDDTCWHYAAIHKFGRLSQSFAYPSMAISLPADRMFSWRHVSHFRKTFHLERPPSTAALRIYLDDEGEVFLNGRLVAALAPEDMVTELDVSEFLEAGENVLAIRLANAEYDECVCAQLHAAP